jgi:hypothetical protein
MESKQITEQLAALSFTDAQRSIIVNEINNALTPLLIAMSGIIIPLDIRQDCYDRIHAVAEGVKQSSGNVELSPRVFYFVDEEQGYTLRLTARGKDLTIDKRVGGEWSTLCISREEPGVEIL